MDSQGPGRRYFQLDKNTVPTLPTLWRWAKFAGGATLATVLMSAGSLASNILIFRLLPPAGAGQFALLIALSQTMAMLISLGQPGLIRRLYSLRPLGYYDWRRDLLGTMLLVLPVAAAGSLTAGLVYRLSLGYGLFVFTAALSFVALMTASHVLASQQHYVWSNVLVRLPYNLLLICLLPVAFLPAADRLPYLAGSQLVVLAASVSIGGLLLRRLVQRGQAHIRLPDRRQGVAFVTSSVAYHIPEEGLLSIAGALVPPEQLAAAAALLLFLRLFGMSYDILGHILVTELARRDVIRYRQMLISLLALTGSMSVGALLLIPAVSSLVYGGLYDAYRFLIPWLVLGAALQLVEVLPRSHIFARVPDPIMNRYIAIHAVIALLGAGLTVGLIVRLGILGLAMGGAGLYLARSLASYYFSIRSRRRSLQDPAARHRPV